MLLDRALGHPELTGDAGVRPALRHQREHLALARREHVERVVHAPRGHELPHERRVDRGAALHDALERVGELVHVRDAVLEQVRAALAAREQVHRVLHLDVRREDDDRRLGQLLPDRTRRVEALGRVRRRHADVDDGEIGTLLANQGEQLVAVARLPDDLEAEPLEQAREALAEQDVVVGQDGAGAGLGHPPDYRLPSST